MRLRGGEAQGWGVSSKKASRSRRISSDSAAAARNPHLNSTGKRCRLPATPWWPSKAVSPVSREDPGQDRVLPGHQGSPWTQDACTGHPRTFGPPWPHRAATAHEPAAPRPRPGPPLCSTPAAAFPRLLDFAPRSHPHGPGPGRAVPSPVWQRPTPIFSFPSLFSPYLSVFTVTWNFPAWQGLKA